MEYTKLGTTDITVSKLCVGCMSFGKAGTLHDWTVDETETREHRKTRSGRKIRRKNAADRSGLGMGKGRSFSDYRSYKSIPF